MTSQAALKIDYITELERSLADAQADARHAAQQADAELRSVAWKLRCAARDMLHCIDHLYGDDVMRRSAFTTALREAVAAYDAMERRTI